MKFLTLPEGKAKGFSIPHTPDHYFQMQVVGYVAVSKYGQLCAAKRIAPNLYANAIDVIDTTSGVTIYTTGPIDDLVTDTALSPDGSKLATALYDGTILIWKVFDKANGEKMDETVLQKNWEIISTSYMPKVWESIERMSSHPSKTVAFLSTKMFPQKNDLPEDTNKLIEELESDSFAKRRGAFTKLKSYGSLIMHELQKAAKNANSSEQKARLSKLIESSETQILRGIQILERIGALKAKPLMEKLAEGAPKAKQTLESRRILKRWKQ